MTLVCDAFVVQGGLHAAGAGMPNLPFAAYPGQVHFASPEELQRNVATLMVDQVIQGLTVQPTDAKPVAEPEPRDIVLKGTFKEVNRFFYNREWSDGLAIVPPTIEEVEEFLKYTSRSPDEVIGVLLPDNREATVWNVAVNGVMASCHPEYMPVLIAVVEGMSDPKIRSRAPWTYTRDRGTDNHKRTDHQRPRLQLRARSVAGWLSGEYQYWSFLEAIFKKCGRIPASQN